ncbi:Predicted 5' DNA nuclease, flap endonuclease-1-like, helix-3-turn-helix (H3TH) domain [Sphingomonas palmae]|uniref:Predicted 5' DNA nuclease, flap endonuclease-1-like, helix-3-turn-helix (H3TH) domain n=1 Tax=Sphingomonas palmae TaxID=1855283 RepID=A0A1H7L8H7_9SPHN|nr:hypothetical protein [Sphingomonas palmae]SEK95261.1 Predicted 5' DNA nuclease, flap endonuclease-1-like, helix-3-turn-helix (H3TH) domain [Sphingomonas palmae]
MIPFSQDSVLVLVALGLVAVLAILTILGMIKGARLKSARRAAEKEEQARIDALREDGVEEREADNAGESFTDAPPRNAASTLAPEKPEEAGDCDGHDAAPLASSTSPEAPTETIHQDQTDDRLSDEQPSERPLADEPIAAAAPLDASPASAAADAPGAGEPAPAPAATTPGNGSITQLKGLGPKIAARLGELGITQVDQLAWLDDAEAAELDAKLGAFQGRMERDRWREQARFLAKGDRAGYEAQFGKLG